jgi:hypothetical protein
MYPLPTLPSLVPKLDEAIRGDLLGCRDWYFGWLVASSVIVAVGVLMEGPEVVHDTINFFRTGETKTKPAWITVLALFGWLLVAVGVAGEGIAETLVSKADGAVQTFNEILLTEARKEAGAAEASAEGAAMAASLATDSAGEAMTLAHDARKEADSFERDIVSAKEQAAKAESHLAEALRQVASAEAEISALRKKGEPRRLTEAQKVELVKLLSAAPPFTVGFLPLRNSSKETSDFADDLIDVFTRMKLMPSGTSARTLDRSIGASDARGIVVGVMSKEQHPLAAELLIAMLRAWGFEAEGDAAPTIAKGPNEMQILVSAKE